MCPIFLRYLEGRRRSSSGVVMDNGLPQHDIRRILLLKFGDQTHALPFASWSKPSSRAEALYDEAYIRSELLRIQKYIQEELIFCSDIQISILFRIFPTDM